MPEETALQHLVRTFRDALSALDCEVPPSVLERWAIEVHYAMSAGGRWFHTIEHVFEISGGAEPIQVLAALFHDTIYTQVDGGLPYRLESRLGDLVGERLTFRHDPQATTIAAIFEVDEGPIDQMSGLNEYLSAVFAARCLAEAVPDTVIWPVVACIERTIPFRPRGGAVDLQRRMESLLGPEQAHQAVVWAQDLANRDVGNFASADLAFFLDNTWKLLPESNAGLRQSVYTIGEYASAIEKMHDFFCFLDPALVFDSYDGVPAAHKLERMERAAALNLLLGKRYLDAKLLAANVLAALANATGGDAPISLFMGDLPSIRPNTLRVEHLLPQPTMPQGGDPCLYRLFTEGRTTEHGFDLRHSPLAAFLYSRLGPEIHDIVDALKELPAEQRGAFVFERTRPTLDVVVRTTAKLAVTRKDQLLALIA